MRTLITDACIVTGDGTTAPFEGDVLIEDGVVAHVGQVPHGPQKTSHVVINARGRALAPGFVDMHNHGALGGTVVDESGFPRACAMSIRGGVTKRICGVDGLSPAPVEPRMRRDYAAQLKPLDGDIGAPWTWTTLEGFYEWHRGRSVTDLGMYLGHSAVRLAVMGNAPRRASPDELRAMAALVRREAKAALGLSTGLVYNPAVYSDAQELTVLMRAFVAERPGALFPHLRSESDTIVEALHEAATVAVEAGGAYCNEHTKIAGADNYHKVGAVEAVLADAAGQVPAIENMYPYTSGSTMGTAIFPPVIRAGTRARFLQRLRGQKVRKLAWTWITDDRQSWDNFVAFCGGLQGIQIAGVKCTEDERFLGRRLSDVAEAAGWPDPTTFGAFDAVCDFFVRNDLDVGIITHYGDEHIMLRFFQRDTMAICTDGLMPGPGQKPHPRVIGAFPKALRLARELSIPLERIVYRMSTLPCQFLGLPSPVIRPGADASLVLFDAKRARELNSFEEPLTLPRGIDHVWIHGAHVLREGVLHRPEVLPGRILRRAS